MTRTRLALLVAGALTGFAANSLLCRAALRDPQIDPVTFTTVRLASGAVALVALSLLANGRARGGTWRGAIALFGYAILFSLAYVRLTTGTGALLLFGSVQLTMLSAGIAKGDRPKPLEWVGLALAVAGLVGLVAPGVTAPDPLAAGAMFVAGVGWGAYTLLGRGATKPLVMTAGNFLRSVPLAIVAVFVATVLEGRPMPEHAIPPLGGYMGATWLGLLLACASGVLASGLGYTLWYAALPQLTRTRAAVLQLSVPVITAIAGIAFLREDPTLRLAVCSAIILGGIALAIRAKA